jgi:hypothetical protein
MPLIPNVRLVPPPDQVVKNLGLLADLAGTWRGSGFNLIARPNKQGNANLFLQLSQTRETLSIDPISSSVPNRGFLQGDIELFGLTYLQQISDTTTGGALHIEPGIWVTVPATTAPPELQSIARLATIPHGNSMLAEGQAEQFAPGPTSILGGLFPSFNSAPFGIGGGVKTQGTQGGFPQYDLAVPESASNPRTPFGNIPPIPLPADIDGVPMQKVVNDPIILLQKVLDDQVAAGHSIERMVVLNIATQASVNFDNSSGGTTAVTVPLGGGGIENLPFLQKNAGVATVYATFWIERIAHPSLPTFMQLQYAQMVFLNFPILTAPPPQPVLTWPHVSVATLRQIFG